MASVSEQCKYSLIKNISIKEKGYYLQFHLFREAAFLVGRPFSSFIGPGIPLIRAQKLLRLAASFSVLGCGAGAFRLLPVSLLYFARPLAVRPAPLDTGSFSPLDTDRFTCFLAIIYTLTKGLLGAVLPRNNSPFFTLITCPTRSVFPFRPTHTLPLSVSTHL